MSYLFFVKLMLKIKDETPNGISSHQISDYTLYTLASKGNNVNISADCLSVG